MATDLPDYHAYVVPVKVEIPPVDPSPMNVGEYDLSPEDLPDGERGPLLLDVKGRLYVRLKDVEPVSGKVPVIMTDTAPVELPDYPPEDEKLPVIAHPKGGVLAKGSLTTTASYQTVASRTVTVGTSLQLAKILVSCVQDVVYKLRWNAVDISAEIYVAGKVPFPDWFPWDYYAMPGDGAKAFDIQVKYPSGGSAGTCNAEIVGEEV